MAAGRLPDEMQFRRHAIAPAHLTTWLSVMLPRRSGSLRTESKERTTDPYTPALLAAGLAATRMLSKREGRIRATVAAIARFPSGGLGIAQLPSGRLAGSRTVDDLKVSKQEGVSANTADKASKKKSAKSALQDNNNETQRTSR